MQDISKCFLLFLMVFQANGQASSDITIDTTQGTVHGFTRDTDFGKIRVFLGLPYAKPPVGSLRLRPPERAPNFAAYNATYYRPNCIQIAPDGSQQSEDCLYLNVYTPATITQNVPVMVWIHGGSFNMGSGSGYVPNNMVARGNVIVVTINYRLGLLGFFPGSGVERTLGLRDQIMALEWVRENIQSYGGDAKEVTIFGESAGSISVSFLTLSPKAKGLFKRAVCQSGVSGSLHKLFPKFDDNLRRQMLATTGWEFGCVTPDPVDCARQIPAEKWTQFVMKDKFYPFYYPDVDDEVILADHATNPSLLHPDLDLIIGLNMNDGGISVYYICSNMMTQVCKPGAGVDRERLFSTINLPKMGNDQQEILEKTYTNWYPYPAPDDKVNILAASELATDVQFRLPTNESATNAERNGNTVYVYLFNSRLEDDKHIPWRSTWTENADHADDLGFLFDWVKTTDKNYKVSLGMIDIWTNFAKGQLPYNWPKFTAAEEYLLIDDENPSGKTAQHIVPGEKNKFWQHYKNTGLFPDLWIVSNGNTCRVDVLNMVVAMVLGFLVITWL